MQPTPDEFAKAIMGVVAILSFMLGSLGAKEYLFNMESEGVKLLVIGWCGFALFLTMLSMYIYWQRPRHSW